MGVSIDIRDGAKIVELNDKMQRERDPKELARLVEQLARLLEDQASKKDPGSMAQKKKKEIEKGIASARRLQPPMRHCDLFADHNCDGELTSIAALPSQARVFSCKKCRAEFSIELSSSWVQANQPNGGKTES